MHDIEDQEAMHLPETPPWWHHTSARPLLHRAFGGLP
jgi:hypothetical protein